MASKPTDPTGGSPSGRGQRSGMIKAQILRALAHPEAQEGLYFRNLYYHHEEDERPQVEGGQVEILDALRELMADGQVSMDDTGKEVVFFLQRRAEQPEQ